MLINHGWIGAVGDARPGQRIVLCDVQEFDVVARPILISGYRPASLVSACDEYSEYGKVWCVELTQMNPHYRPVRTPSFVLMADPVLQRTPRTSSKPLHPARDSSSFGSVSRFTNRNRMQGRTTKSQAL